MCSRKYLLRGCDRHKRVVSEAELWLICEFVFINLRFFAFNGEVLEADTIIIRLMQITKHFVYSVFLFVLF